jgi:hypothetical protein
VRFDFDTAASRYWFLRQRKVLRWASRCRHGGHRDWRVICIVTHKTSRSTFIQSNLSYQSPHATSCMTRGYLD